MKHSLEIRLKEEKEPTIWGRFLQWLNGHESQPRRSVLQVPKTGTNTEILLSQTQRIKLKDAVESPGERPSDTGFARKSDAAQESSNLII